MAIGSFRTAATVGTRGTVGVARMSRSAMVRAASVWSARRRYCWRKSPTASKEAAAAMMPATTGSTSLRWALTKSPTAARVEQLDCPLEPGERLVVALPAEDGAWRNSHG